MSRQCSKAGCEFEIDYACECLSLQTYWCQFHLGEHLKLFNRAHAFDIIIAELSQETNDSILDFLEKEKSKIDKLKEIILVSLSPNLYNSKISIEETLKKIDYNLKEINGLIKKVTKSLKQSKDFNIKELNNSELYNARLCFILNQLKSKQNEILGSSNNEPNAERDFRRTCYLYENSSSDPTLRHAYHEYVEAHDKLTSLYLIDRKEDEKTRLYIYNTEGESEKVKVLDIPQNYESEWSICITQLPNGELFRFSTSGKAFIIDGKYNIRKLPSWKPGGSASGIYFNRSVYYFGAIENYHSKSSVRFDLDQNRWIQLSPMIKEECNCSGVIFNGNILMTGHRNTNLLLYSIDLDSFTSIPYDFDRYVTKILIKGEKRLYLIQCSGAIFESDIDDEYTWKRIPSSTIDLDSLQYFQASYNNGGIYISLLCRKSRRYFKFDLAQKALTEIAVYSEYSAVKRSSSKHGDIECYGQTFKLDSDSAKAFINKGKHSFYRLGDTLREIECLNVKIKNCPNKIENYLSKGHFLCELGSYYEAIEYCDQFIELFSRNNEISPKKDWFYEPINSYASACTYKGIALCKLRRYDEAIECCNEAIRLNPMESSAFECKTEALNSLGRKREAIECDNERKNIAYPII